MLTAMFARSRVLVLVALASCSAVSPPPLVPMHGGTAPHGEDEVTITLVVGVAGELLGGDGVGVALRGERQLTDGGSIGVQLGGGRGKEGEAIEEHGRAPRHWLVEVRGYGKLTSPDHDWVAGLASVGLTTMDTGLIATTLAIGGAVSYPNRYAVPALGLFAAVSHPWRRGAGLGRDGARPDTTWWLGGSVGLAVPIGDTGNVPSAELGAVWGTSAADDSGQLSLSIADGHTF